MVWQDRNGDHRTEAGELESLSQAGIASLDVHYTLQPQLQNGNWLKERGQLTMTDGRSLAIAEAYFETDASEAAASSAAAGKAAMVSASRTASITVHSMLQATDPIIATPRTGSATSLLTEEAQRQVGSIHPRMPVQATRPTVQPAPIRPVIGQPAHRAAAPTNPAPASLQPSGVDQQLGLPAFGFAAQAADPAIDSSVIDWTARSGARGKQKVTPVHQPWVTEFLGVKSPEAQDLASLTGLRVRIPAEPSRDLAK